jgi:Domain of Unknown Function (DUF1080)
MRTICLFLFLASVASAADNELTAKEKADGWVLLFDGRTLDGWMTSNQTPSNTPVEDGCINPHKAGGYMMVHKEKRENFVLALDYKISKKCNSGVFIRTSSLDPKPGRDVGFNGIEVAIDDTYGTGYHDPGALYDLVKPSKQMQKPAGEWNHMVITCDQSKITVELNGEVVTKADLDEFTKSFTRPDGTAHKFDEVYKNHARNGYIGLQDHGSPCRYKNIKLKVLK